MLTINQELHHGRYRITKQFGQGKTVSFFEAHDKVLEKNVLLKKMLVNVNDSITPAQQEAKQTAFANESKFLTNIKHDGFLQILDHFSDSDSLYLVMELVDGKNIGEILKKQETPFALSDVVDWGKQMLAALAYLHQKNPPIIYFNVKPQNVHLTSRGNIKLLATGIDTRANTTAHIADQTFDAANLNYSPLELIWGKLDSASQRVILNDYDEKSEQILTQKPGVRSDIYSLGATLYHLLTGKLPVDALERSIELLEGNHDPLSSPNEVDSEIAVEISNIVMKALEIRRENRFETALEMLDALEKAYAQLRERKAQALRSEVPAKPVSRIEMLSKPVVRKEKPAVSETPKIKSEESKQLELMKQKLREAEEQRLLAEQRASEAERRLIAMETQEFKLSEILENQDLPTVSEQSAVSEEVEEKTAEAEVWQESFEEDTEKESIDNTQDTASEEFSMFAEPPKNNKIMKRMAAAAIGIILIGGGVFGVMKFLPSAKAGTEQNVTNQVSTTESAAENQPVAETSPLTESEATPEMTEAQTSGETLETKQNPAENLQNPAAAKEKTPLPQIATGKTPAPPKSAVVENDKKKVTVDDLINDAPNKKKKVTVDDLINGN